MFQSDFLILSLTLIAIVLLGILVISRDPRSVTNRLFFSLVGVMSIWCLVNYFSIKDDHNFLLVRLVLFWAVLFAAVFYFFVLSYPLKELEVIKKKYIYLSLLTILVMALTLSPLVFKELTFSSNSSLGKPVVGPGIALFALTVGFYDIGGLVILARKTIITQGEEKIRRIYLFIGLALMLLTIIILNFILPSVFSVTSFIPFAPLFILPFVAFTTYAIIKHRLLDIKTAAARGFTYLLTLGSIGFIYGSMTFLFTGFVSSGESVSTSQRIFYIGFALFTALIFPFIKRYFDHITNSIFFRDDYDTQTFFDGLNTILVSALELESLLHRSADFIGATLKSDNVFYILENKTKGRARFIGNKIDQYEIKHLKKIIYLFNIRHQSVVFADSLVSETYSELHELMGDQNIGIIVRLVTNTQQIGYIFIGVKQSGDSYTNRDSSVLNIVAGELAIAIENALRFEEIKNFNLTLQAKVDDATKQLRRANERLKELDETKDDFISMASHQLRTPLTSVKGYLSMVLEGDAGRLTKMEKEMLGQAFFSSQRMVYLIADLLNVSRLKTGKFIIEPTVVNLATLVEQELDQLKETAASRKLTLSFDRPKDFPDVMLDETKIRQVIMNFVDNAIYYTQAGGHIEVKLIDKPSVIELKVEDNGIGVPASEKPHLFTKFYRAGNARKARPDGTGLGLFMAKKVIISEGGSIIFESEAGKGSTFGFMFSKTKIAVPDHMSRPENKLSA